MPKSLQQQATQLRDKLNKHNYYYYVLDNPRIPDSEYDTRKRGFSLARNRKNRRALLCSQRKTIAG